MAPTLVDAGPLVALYDRRDRHHAWAAAQVIGSRTALVTCEPVVVEACYLLRRNVPGAERSLLEALARGRFVVGFDLQDEAAAVADLIGRYANVPMDLADACLVRMAELYPAARVLTIDGDFLIYRKNGREPVPATLPDDRA